MAFGCHSCKWRDDPDRLDRCLACSLSHEDQVASLRVGSGGAVSLDAADNSDLILRRAQIQAKSRTGQATTLPTEVEDNYRQAWTTFFGLNDWDKLLLAHLANGENIAEAVRNIPFRMPGAEKLKNGGDKRHAWARLQNIIAAYPPFGELVNRMKRSQRKHVSKQTKLRTKQLEFNF